MRTQTHSQQNSTSTIVPAPIITAPWRIQRVDVISQYVLHVQFLDGLTGNIIFEPSFFTGVFAPLLNFNEFKKVEIIYGALTWHEEIDLAPDAMYYEIQKNGEWVLT